MQLVAVALLLAGQPAASLEGVVITSGRGVADGTIYAVSAPCQRGSASVSFAHSVAPTITVTAPGGTVAYLASTELARAMTGLGRIEQHSLQCENSRKRIVWTVRTVDAVGGQPRVVTSSAHFDHQAKLTKLLAASDVEPALDYLRYIEAESKRDRAAK